ncbi:hypothetical protein A2713_01260 [candidate division WWE3 bacterium RIFCSPHIGHO2_01_FULL_35_17]|uniref:CopG family transcriptional regulator n=1 Tax=candidate division WWE3 bacterium RIFCSPHIGHO2_01_FULL_35_17 TaxID=1802614 RepID=A0A1F4US87_UNCKA|nr:MAG: hypothetical protein A2713_01260 [candidate division WWE3 bacterium RIFCSPHIGHO2_01_FULL_35_17]
MTNLKKLHSKTLYGYGNADFRRIHISLPAELADLLSRQYPNGSRSRMISLAIIERLQKIEEVELESVRKELGDFLGVE